MRTTTKNKSDKGSSAAAAANGLPNPKGNPIPKRKYDLSRPYCTGDEVYVCKCYGRTRLARKQLSTHQLISANLRLN